MLIPVSMQDDIISKIHWAHQGITKCRERVENSVWRPGPSIGIENMVRKCDVFAKSLNDHT